MSAKSILSELFSEVGIQINGNNPWDITVHNEKFYEEILNDTELKFGETYMEKWWDCPKLDEFFFRLIKGNIEKKAFEYPVFWKSAIKQYFFDKVHASFNHQDKEKSLEVGRKHYDVGNDLYEIMLDKRLVYTCAYWLGTHDLDEAQEKKLELVCKKVQLKPGMKVLDVGCGWGSFAKYAAETYKVSVVGITISHSQCALAKKLTAGLDVEIRFQDYRDLINSPEKYDAIVSLGMFEHVGFKNYTTYMRTLSHCLKDDGLFLLHTIGSNDRQKSTNKWINAYIFPHGQLPSIRHISQSIEKIFVMEDLENFGVYYDKTLMAWHHNFNAGWDKLKSNYDEQFKRMWDYYLLSCAGSFRARENQLWQIVLSKGLLQGYRRPVFAK